VKHIAHLNDRKFHEIFVMHTEKPDCRLAGSGGSITLDGKYYTDWERTGLWLLVEDSVHW
jgi:hypothetical protein